MTTINDLDRKTLVHPFAHLADHDAGNTPSRVIKKGKGIRIYDTDGIELIDAFSGLYCVNIGYGNEAVADAIAEQARELAYYHAYAGHGSEPSIKLSDEILKWYGPGMARVFYGLSGSDANETQAKIVWYYNNVLGRPAKKKIISRLRGYHGATVISGSMTGLPFYHTAFDMPCGPILHTTNPHYYFEAEDGMTEAEFSKKCARDLEEMILREGPDTVAAFIGEPMLGTGGIITPPENYWAEIQAVLNKYDILLIADEVVCGFGRTGENFGSHLYGMKPDLITIAKGLTSAYLPLSGSIVGDKVWDVLKQGSEKYGPFSHGYTYTAHPLCAAAGLANLKVLKDNNIVANAKDTGAYFNSELRKAFSQHPLVGEVRGQGMLGALEFVQDRSQKQRFDAALKVGAQVSAATLKRGIIARAMPHGDILGFAPPLITTKEDVDHIIKTVAEAVNEVTDTLTAQGVKLA
ncbi:aminotransferase [Kordiimonas pumila]|uniref:Aminotransferase n=1 Tax=Kordiimonas pumila TaxID=2161677 RepID=A0ABV7D4V3_9PROT|nr:aminotransferase [Kordiimonas pumila]